MREMDGERLWVIGNGFWVKVKVCGSDLPEPRTFEPYAY
jgi:hypothetical protein